MQILEDLRLLCLIKRLFLSSLLIIAKVRIDKVLVVACQLFQNELGVPFQSYRVGSIREVGVVVLKALDDCHVLGNAACACRSQRPRSLPYFLQIRQREAHGTAPPPSSGGFVTGSAMKLDYVL